METKKLGFLIMGLTAAFGLFLFTYMGQLNAQGQQFKCNPTKECMQVNSMLGVSHAAVGFLSFIFALGFYLLFFSRSEKEAYWKHSAYERYNANNNADNRINNNLNNAKNSAPNNGNAVFSEKLDRFSLLLRPLDDNEKKVLISIKEQEGITQSTLRFRANLSKSKISQILTDFEKKSLIERKAKGKTYQVFLTDNYDVQN